MSILYFSITFFVLCLTASALLTKCLIKLLTKWAIVDKPSGRRSHKKITPRGGGVAIWLVFFIAFIYADYIFLNSNYSPVLLPIFTLIGVISLYDDIKGTDALFRLVIHLFAAAVSIYYFLYPNPLLHGELPLWIDFTLATIGFAGFMNLYNFLDGIDGITSVETIHLSITMLMLCLLRGDVIYCSKLVIIISFIVLACSFGFIIYNWPPASIFLGDIGSISLGFLMGLCLILVAASGERLFVACGIASLYYIADGGITILIRIIKKEKIWLPHLNHFFQNAIKKGMSHKEVTLKIAFCNFILFWLAINALFYPAISILLAVFIVMCILIHFC